MLIVLQVFRHRPPLKQQSFTHLCLPSLPPVDPGHMDGMAVEESMTHLILIETPLEELKETE